MKLWKIMAVSALVFSGSSMASGFGYGGGPSTPVFQTTNWHEELQIYQEGSLNLANATQTSAQNSLTTVNQHGNANVASSNQVGDRSLLDIHQAGNFNRADALQSGDKSKLLISQSGTANYANATQSASGSLANIVQVGTANRAYASQQ
ncbi:curli major subunit CsgA [Serratia sp. M24T3]|uniref:curli major subunit CsgA n=1 Tax=Serratia sp. M24T3 TaxID=932213 RepID=UPI00025B8E4A|nr:curli major subunit CsgA [Serratia sp. M24T3]EIC85162.1 major curlin subunit [Serratia sp. M24T3]